MITTANLGFPRMGADRELKWALEQHWRGDLDAAGLHDVAVTLGALTLMNWIGLIEGEINLAMIAAILTIIGWSQNDTIVIFDRVRENLPRVKGSLSDVLNLSINQTLSRTLLTSLTTLIAVVIHRWWIAWWRRPGWRYRALGAGCAVLAVLHLGLAPLARLAFPMGLERDLGGPGRAISEAELDPATLPTQTAVVLVAPNIIVGLHAGFSRRLARLPMPAAWRVLSWAPSPHRFVRTGVDTFEMEVERNGLESAALKPGMVVTVSGMEATVLDGAALGPHRIRIRFDRSIDDPSMTLLGWSDGRLRRVEPPPVGGSIDIHAPFY